MGMNVVSMIVCEMLTDAASAADHLLDFVATRPGRNERRKQNAGFSEAGHHSHWSDCQRPNEYPIAEGLQDFTDHSGSRIMRPQRGRHCDPSTCRRLGM